MFLRTSSIFLNALTREPVLLKITARQENGFTVFRNWPGENAMVSNSLFPDPLAPCSYPLDAYAYFLYFLECNLDPSRSGSEYGSVPSSSEVDSSFSEPDEGGDDDAL